MPNGNDPPRRRTGSPCAHGDDASPGGGGDLIRCDCGSLLARYVGGRIELKCRRCKRIIPVTIEHAPEDRTG